MIVIVTVAAASVIRAVVTVASPHHTQPQQVGRLNGN